MFNKLVPCNHLVYQLTKVQNRKCKRFILRGTSQYFCLLKGEMLLFILGSKITNH